MAIISTIGRRAPRVRAFIAGIYLILGLGAVTMVYPFLLMLGGTSKSGVDTPDAEVVPRFLVDDTALYGKDAEGFFNESLSPARLSFNVAEPSFRTFSAPARPNPALVAAWREFLMGSPVGPDYYEIAYVGTVQSRETQPLNLRRFKKAMARRFGGDLDRLNLEMQSEFVSWGGFRATIRYPMLSRTTPPGRSGLDHAYREFKETRPIEERHYPSIEAFYRLEFLQNQYGRDIAAYNQAHGTAFADWAGVVLPRQCPEATVSPRSRQDWEIFVREILSPLSFRLDEAANPAYRHYLAARYQGRIASLNKLHGTAHADFAEVSLPHGAPTLGGEMTDVIAFVQGWDDPETGTRHQAPAEAIAIHSVDFMFRDFLRERHGSIAALNQAAGTAFEDWMEILPPQRDAHFLAWFQPQRGALRREFAVRNFIAVAEFVLLQGRAVFNTVVFCLLTILCALVVNPLAAYALSRYRPPSAYKILLFLMMTMAFPPMVTQIPNFLLLRELGLLNTFAALILPGMANGYSIFLLKGFFDSLPKELYESAEIDGAGEFCIFWQITMSLSTPILAVIALNAFNAAYSNFMMALLVCQEPRMWTLMPWLYQLQMRSGQGIVFASLVIAAVPTFLVFTLCQNVIMRGIVVPVEK
jgi:multiple sugar transport system permease protein